METIWLSWSRLRTHEECREKGFLSRKNQRETSNVRNFLGGNLVDRIVRDWLQDDPYNNLDAMPDMVPEYMNMVIEESKSRKGQYIKWNSEEDKNNVMRDGVEAVKRIRQDLEKYVLPYEYKADYAFKSPIKVPVEGHGEVEVMLNGYMDIFVKRRDEDYAIYDVKQTKNEQYYKSTLGQLAFYDIATVLNEGSYSSHSALLQPLCKTPVREFYITDEDRMKMFQSISLYAADVLNENFEPTKNTSICGNCDWRNSCSKFKPTMKNGKRVYSL